MNKKSICVFATFLIAAAAIVQADAQAPQGQEVSAFPVFGAGLSLSRPNVSLLSGIALPGWSFKGAAGGIDATADGWRHFKIITGSSATAPVLDGRARFSAEGAAVHAEWRLVPTANVNLLETFVGFNLPGSAIIGGTAVVDGNPIPVSLDGDKPHLYRGAVSNVAFVSPAGEEVLRFDFDRQVRILLQDGAYWGSSHLTVRIFFAEGPLAGGREYSLVANVSTPSSGPIALKEAGGVTITAGPDWIPLANEPWIDPGSALDFTQVVPHHAPAGKFGRVIPVGDHFEFEGLPGVPQRFYGVNICGDANVPSTREAASRFAAQLSRVGYNTLRIHHHERNLVSKTANRPADDAGFDDTVPDPERLALFDNLVAACKEHGIYLTTDLFVSRSHLTTWRSLGIDRDGCLSNTADYKILCAFWEPAYSNLLAWSRNFLGHVNPNTGLPLAQDPVLATLALVNEGNIGNWGADILRDLPGVHEAWEAWLVANPDVATAAGLAAGAPIPDGLYAEDGDTPENRRAAAFAIFLSDAEMRLADRLRAFLRDELHCQAPLSSLSCWYNPAQYQLVRARCFDYVDDHFYVDHPVFLDKSWSLPSRCPNTNPMAGGNAGARSVVFRRLMDKPFCLTEWNYSGPGRFRGVGGIATGALGALQNWSGMWRFAWSHGRAGVERPEVKSMGYFDMSGDPLGLAAERAAICLFLRGDLPTLPAEYPVVLDAEALRDPRNGAPRCENGSWLWAAWNARLGTTVQVGARGPSLHTPASQVRADLAAIGADSPGNGAIFIDSMTGTFLIDTPRTAGGFAETGVHNAGPVKFELLPPNQGPANQSPVAATVWASSLDGRPIAESSRLLVTHLTDVQNSDICYGDPDLTILLKWGHLPHLMRNGAAMVELKLSTSKNIETAGNPAEWRVWRLSPAGRRLGTVPATWDQASGRLTFTARTDYDPSSASFLYEIVRE